MTTLTAPTATLHAESTLPRRAVATIIAAAGLALLTFAATLQPDPSGMGTHQQLGLPPCSLYAFTGYPCPTCGMTTSFAWAAHGHVIQAIIVQPAGGLAALAVAATTLLAAFVAATGLSIYRWLQPLRQPKTAVVVLLIILAAWAYKIVMVKGWPG